MLGLGINISKYQAPNTGGLKGALANAALAYSVARAFDGYDGPIVRVRRTTDNAEQDFTSAEVNSGGIETFCAGTGSIYGLVVKWYNQANPGNHDLERPVASDQPRILQESSIFRVNGFPAFKFNGTNIALYAGVLPEYFTTQSYETKWQNFSVMQINNVTTGGAQFPLVRGTVNGKDWSNTVYHFSNNSTDYDVNFNGATLSATVPNTLGQYALYYLEMTVRDAGSSLRTIGEVRFNGGARYHSWNFASTASPTYSDLLGLARHTNTFYSEFILCEDIVDANRIDIHNDINTFYSLY